MQIKQRKELNALTRLHWSAAKLLLICGGTHTQNVDFFVDFLHLVDLLCTSSLECSLCTRDAGSQFINSVGASHS